MDLSKLCAEVRDLMKEVGEFIDGERGKFTSDAVESKGGLDFVSYVDKTAERMLVDRLKKIFPKAGFVAEEGTATMHGERYSWIIDPLDGTTNFIHGAPPFAISVALAENEDVILGVILEIACSECFYAWKGGGAYMNGEEIHVSDASRSGEALIATGFPCCDFKMLEDYMELYEHFTKTTQGIRRLGSAATDLAYLAAGRYDAFWECSLHAWDVAAGAIIVKEAGGRVSDFSGGNNYLFGGELIASNNAYFDEFYKIVHKYHGK